MNKVMIMVTMLAIAGVGVITSVLASPVSKAVVKGGEKAAAELGLRIAGKNAVRGGAKLAAVTAERAVAKRTAGGTVESVAKHVTAKQILAAGGGAALVVAAHETADGVQQMGEGVKAAVVANPELAGGVAESVTAPVKWLVVMVSAVALSFLVWILWPWISLVKNWSRFVAGRRAAAMRGVASVTGCTVDVIDESPSPPGSARSGFTRVELIIAVAGFLLLTGIGVWRIARSGKLDSNTSPVGSDNTTRQEVLVAPQEVQAVPQEVRVAERAKKVARLQTDYTAAIDRHYATFVSEVESVAAARFGNVRNGIPRVVDEFGTFSRCKDLLVTLVRDKMDNGCRTANSLKHDLEANFYRGLYDARDKVNACLVSFLKNAEAERQAFRHELEVELDSIELPGDEAFRKILSDGAERIETCKRELAEGQIVAAISAIIEATCIRITVSTISKILGKAAARMAGSAAIGAGSAMADGPLPIGDVIGGAVVLGSTCWTAYDIWQATEVLPKELSNALSEAADDCEAKTVRDFKNAGDEIYRIYRDAHN